MVFPWFAHSFPSINPLTHWDWPVQVGHVAALERGRGARASLVQRSGALFLVVVSHEAMLFVPCVNVFSLIIRSKEIFTTCSAAKIESILGTVCMPMIAHGGMHARAF